MWNEAVANQTASTTTCTHACSIPCTSRNLIRRQWLILLLLCCLLASLVYDRTWEKSGKRTAGTRCTCTCTSSWCNCAFAQCRLWHVLKYTYVDKWMHSSVVCVHKCFLLNILQSHDGLCEVLSCIHASDAHEQFGVIKMCQLVTCYSLNQRSNGVNRVSTCCRVSSSNCTYIITHGSWENIGALCLHCFMYFTAYHNIIKQFFHPSRHNFCRQCLTHGLFLNSAELQPNGQYLSVSLVIISLRAGAHVLCVGMYEWGFVPCLSPWPRVDVSSRSEMRWSGEGTKVLASALGFTQQCLIIRRQKHSFPCPSLW